MINVFHAGLSRIFNLRNAKIYFKFKFRIIFTQEMDLNVKEVLNFFQIVFYNHKNLRKLLFSALTFEVFEVLRVTPEYV